MQKPKRKNIEKLILGITGSFGSGKTTVAGIFNSYGARVINADKIAHKLLKSNRLVSKKIVCIFGDKVLSPGGGINRRKLGEIVFNNKNLLKKLNAIVHPEVMRIIKDKTLRCKSGLVVWDVPLLFETGMDKRVDKLIVVNADLLNQINRIQKKTALGKDEILKRIKSQMPLKDKLRRADFVIDNNKSLTEAKKQVKKILEKLNLSLAE